ncbi:hypothetical protein CVT24_001584 [Panaeolus cyanescens]|uniref:BZIP domain-containing protein n=1 Tax=Panaeolus cyanescens TaxID=181874 RepID=A0A409YFB5_9AGAR|nr:hypothetical protein CVT24_001584 [Panaeolus cyanescens]
MPSNTLQGLNIVHPVQDNNDSQDLLAYPDISAQLDLWTNLAFESDEPLVSKTPAKSISEDDEEDVRSPVSGENAVRDGHVNVVTPTNVVVNSTTNTSNPLFDFNSILAGFGLDAFNAAHQLPVPQHAQHQQQLPQQTLPAPSLAQLLALHPNQAAMFAHPGMPHFIPSVAAAAAARSIPNPVAMAQAYARSVPQQPPTQHQQHQQSASAPSEESHLPVKRARTRKPSVSNHDPSDFNQDDAPDSPVSAASPLNQSTSTPLSAAEDKRRRNTAASARFRLKKKEREQALEGRAKELEIKVTELERECEGLRRENGWLKGLVVGVTGAAQSTNGAPGLSVTSPPPGPISSGTKRRRDDESN